MVERDSELFLSVGGSGGSRIITGVLQTVLQSLAFGRNILDSVSLPRMHDQLLPPQLNLEHDFPTQPFVPILLAMKHNVTIRSPSWADAVVQAIKVDDNGQLSAACDWRKMGIRTERCVPYGY